MRRRHHPQDAVAGVRRRVRRVGADALPRPGHHVRVLAGRLRHGLPVLRDRPGRADQEPVGGRDRGAGVRRRQGDGDRCGARRPWPGVERRLHGHGRAAGELLERAGRGAPDHRRRRPRASASPSARSRCRRSAWCRRSGSSPDEGLSVRLAVSLHAPDDELRDELVPVNRRWQVAEVLDAAWGYAAATGRRVSIEYAMIRDINDQAWRADLLASLLAGRLAHVNLIPLNPTPGSKWTASDPGVARRVLRPAGLARHPGDGARHPRRPDRRGLRPARRCPPCSPAIFLQRPGPGYVYRHDVEARARQASPCADGRAGPGRLAADAAGRNGDRRVRGRTPVRRVRARLAHGLPDRRRLRRALDRGRRPVHDRRARHALRGHGARP